MASTSDETLVTKEDDVAIPPLVQGLGVFVILLFTVVAYYLQIFLNQPCIDAGPNVDGICDLKYHAAATFFKAHPIGSFALILTHALPFGLLPYTMAMVNERGADIKKDYPNFKPFVLELSFAVITFGLALEFGWHVSDSWYYTNNFHILNYGFYFFLISGFALWADGFGPVLTWDIVFGVILLAATVLYPIGNYVDLGNEAPIEFLQNAGTAKIPLYIGMSATFAEVTKRGLTIFGNKMWIVAFLSLGVNLGFIAVLNGYQGITVIDGVVEPLVIQNYIYHICHDVLGTEAGVAYFAYLVATYEPKQELLELPEKK